MTADCSALLPTGPEDVSPHSTNISAVQISVKFGVDQLGLLILILLMTAWPFFLALASRQKYEKGQNHRKPNRQVGMKFSNHIHSPLRTNPPSFLLWLYARCASQQGRFHQVYSEYPCSLFDVSQFYVLSSSFTCYIISPAIDPSGPKQ